MLRKEHKLSSWSLAGKIYPHEIGIQETPTKHRKLDSQAALPHPTRDRAAHGLRSQAWPLGHRDATMILVAYRHGLRALGLGHLGAAASGRRQARDDFRFPFDHLGIAAASRCASISLMISIERSICSVVITLIPPECSTCISRGTNIAQTFNYAAGDSHPLEHLSPMLLPILSQIEQKALVEPLCA